MKLYGCTFRGSNYVSFTFALPLSPTPCKQASTFQGNSQILGHKSVKKGPIMTPEGKHCSINYDPGSGEDNNLLKII